MKKAVITAKETVELQEFPMPEIREDQVLVKVKACGLCTFEQRYFTGGKEQYPFNGGHEVCGVVEQVGSRAAASATTAREAWTICAPTAVTTPSPIPCGAPVD